LRNEGLAPFALKALRYPLKPAFVGPAARALHEAAADVTDLGEAVDLANQFNFASISIEPWQVKSELVPLLEILQERRPRTIVEIGTASGGTLFLLTRVAAPDALLVSIDLPRAAFGGGYARWRGRLYEAFARERQRIVLVRADSHTPETAERLQSLLGERAIDFLFIDGDHTYDGARKDFETYRRFVAVDGLVAFHDIVPGSAELVGGVPTLWQELRGRYGGEELVDDWGRGSCGIGLLRASEFASFRT
jgi:cephalosporin hydroxylase